eukprot:gnl/TRDRNA2_/TRDRNA2_157141_c0_seq1.p1 gnl/TRDRNA2_/TRDRNA2_157141_c0~~gnl/TRDRNA2_/TRDRNA2_157141_c0_seq1.p1  ORF type:complete len:239 (-),score=38.23 gnl/TRDRNA2_/TRDRNA2_157141_c0_seq1:42-758(-)
MHDPVEATDALQDGHRSEVLQAPSICDEPAECGSISGLSVLASCRTGSRLDHLRELHGYGSTCDSIGDHILLLSFEEALFLSTELQALDIVLDNRKQTADEIFQYCCTLVSEFPRRYAAYRHLRHKGWTVRPSGLKYGSDFMLYDGRPDQVHAHFAVIIADQNMHWKDVVASNRMAQIVAKDLLLVLFLESSEGGEPGASEGSVTRNLAQPLSLSSFLLSGEARITEIAVRRWQSHLG